MSSDVTVVGAGIFGLSCAWAMVRRGARVRVIEAARIGAGASGGVVGALAPHDPTSWNEKKQIQLDSLISAGAFWDGVQAAGGVDPGYARTGRLQVLPAGGGEAKIDGARAHWPGFRMWVTRGDGPLGAGQDWLADDLSARIAPRRALASLAAALRAQGVEIVENAGDVSPGDVRGTVLWATGAPGLAALGRDLGRAVGDGVKGQAALLAFDAAETPQIYRDGLYIVPHVDGTVAVGSTSETGFAGERALQTSGAQRQVNEGPESPANAGDGDTQSMHNPCTKHAPSMHGIGTDGQLDELVERARALCPALRAAPVVDRWAGIRPRAKSRAPLLGAWPGQPGQFVANGGFKIGFGMAPWVAEAMADLVLEGRDRVPEGWRLE